MSGRAINQHSVWIGARIRALRKERGVNQAMLAHELGISQYQLCKYEKGINRVTLEVASLIADVLNASVEEMRPPTTDRRWRAFEVCKAQW